MKKKIITRHRHGKGFAYRWPDGQLIQEGSQKEWIKSLAIPPAWTDVEITPDKEAKIHATGRDDAGRKQYIYNSAWRQEKKQQNFNRLLRFAHALPRMRHMTGKHLQRDGADRKKVLACMVRLIDTAYFRPGNKRYTEENESYGLTTMRSRHLRVEGDELIFKYTGKAGAGQKRRVIDQKLARIVSDLDDIPGHEIFKYFNREGEKVRVKSQDLNAYIQTVMGEDFTAKDFRTWAGTLLAAVALNKLGVEDEEEARKSNIVEAIKRVSKQLGNTPEIAKSSYIDPRIIDHYHNGRTIEYFMREVNKRHNNSLMSIEERAVTKLLEHGVEDGGK